MYAHNAHAYMKTTIQIKAPNNVPKDASTQLIVITIMFSSKQEKAKHNI